jgi:isopenicillin N synthase-like dioxygenase
MASMRDSLTKFFLQRKRLFALPVKEKLKIEMVKSPHFRSYNRAGQEHTRGERD